MLAPATLATVMVLAARPASSSTRPSELGIGGDGRRRRHDRRDGRGARRVPLPRRRLGAAHLRPRRSRPRSEAPPIEPLVAALVPIYFGRVGSFVIENRDHDDRRRPRSASSARPASSSCSSRTSSSAGSAANGRGRSRRRRRAMTPARAAAGPDPDPGRQPARPPRSWCGSVRRCWTRGPAS